MTLQTGDPAPDFTLPDEDGNPVRLSDLLETGPVVLFFYPAAMTTGCTKESCHFRDLSAQFVAAGAHRVGVSRDPVAKQKEFSLAHRFDYPLLSDEDGTVAQAYGVLRSGLLARLLPVKRATFVIGRGPRILSVVTSETRMDAHAEQALESLARDQ